MVDAVLRLEYFMDDALNDPVVRLVMQRDGVSDREVWLLMKHQQSKWIERHGQDIRAIAE